MSRVADQAEDLLRAVAAPDADPGPAECLVCYVARRLRARPCDHRRLWTTRFRDRRSPTATALEERLLRRGVLCDCGLLGRHGYRLGRTPLVRDLVGERSADPPACDGVRRSSTQPCALWERWPEREPWAPPERPTADPPF